MVSGLVRYVSIMLPPLYAKNYTHSSELPNLHRGKDATVSSTNKKHQSWDIYSCGVKFPDSKVHGANMRPIWVRQDPGGPHVDPKNSAIWGIYLEMGLINCCFSQSISSALLTCSNLLNDSIRQAVIKASENFNDELINPSSQGSRRQLRHGPKWQTWMLWWDSVVASCVNQ